MDFRYAGDSDDQHSRARRRCCRGEQHDQRYCRRGLGLDHVDRNGPDAAIDRRDPANASIAKGATQQFIATGTYSDSSTQNITTVTWASSTPATATITPAGLATGVAVGSSTISATIGAVSGSTTLTVTAPALQSIAVTPANPSITKGATQQFTATGTYSDSTTQNITASVTWTSGTPATATITPAGLATGVAVG